MNGITNKEIKKFINKHKELVDKSVYRKYLWSFVCKIDKIEKILKNFEKSNSFKGEINIYSKLDKFFKEALEFESVVSDSFLLNDTKKLFRKVIKQHMFKSNLLKRGYLKPRGYPGDFKIIEAVYNNKPMSDGMGGFLDAYFLNVDYVKAVRDRKNSMRSILRKYINRHKGGDVLNVLNLACGSCRELRELFESKFRTNKNIHFILVDQDLQCLNFSKNKLKMHVSQNIKFSFVCSDVIEFLKNTDNFLDKPLMKQDLIYSIGLADYLPNSILRILIKQSFSHLRDDGRLIIAHKNTKKYSSSISDWGANWKFIERNQNDLEKTVSEVINEGLYSLDFLFKQNKHIFYLDLYKRNAAIL